MIQPSEFFRTRKRLRGLLTEMLTRLEAHDRIDCFPGIQGCAVLAAEAVARLLPGRCMEPPVEFVVCQRDTDAMDDRILEARQKGLPLHEIARDLEVHLHRVEHAVFRREMPPLIAHTHPEYRYVFQLRISDPLGSPQEFFTGAMADRDEPGKSRTRCVAADTTEAKAALVDVLHKWIRYIDTILQAPVPSVRPVLPSSAKTAASCSGTIKPTGVVANESTPAPRRRRRPGRPRATDPEADRKIGEAWSSGRWTTYAELADAKGMTKGQVKRALDRDRKRLEKHSGTTRRGKTGAT